MDRRLALVALWAAFAAAAVGVGFGAAGLVGDPFSASAPTVSGSATASPSPSGSSSPPRATTPQPSRTGGAGSGDSAVTRTLQTRGGLASATCRSGSVRLSASPAVGWEIKDLDPGPDQEVRVRFEPSEDDNGQVEVRVSCRGGVPRFSLEDDRSGHGGSGGDD